MQKMMVKAWHFDGTEKTPTVFEMKNKIAMYNGAFGSIYISIVNCKRAGNHYNPGKVEDGKRTLNPEDRWNDTIIVLEADYQAFLKKCCGKLQGGVR